MTAFIPEAVKVFTGSVITQTGKKPVEKEIRCTSLDNVIPGPIVKKEVHYIPSFGVFISKIDWSKSASLKQLFLPFQYLGEDKPIEN